MRGTRQRPNSQHSVPAHMRPTAPAGRKVFNCIVDDSALVAGVKKSTRNGIRQWVNNGQIRLFVPLHALEQLSRQKNATNRHGEDVRETLKWLDDATSRYPNVIALQGAEDHFERWADVEKFAVPRTLFSETDGLEDGEADLEDDATADDDMNNLTLADVDRKTSGSSAASDRSRSASPSSMQSHRSSVSAPSPPTSPAKALSSPPKPVAVPTTGSSPSSSVVPARLQSLFNYILWRIHQEENPVAALESFIFLCNDQSKVNYAKGFEIRAKRLEQLRDAISREDRDYRNRQLVLQREHQNTTTAAAPPSLKQSVDDDDEVVYKPPPKAPAAMLPKQQPPQNVIDPDAFGRSGPVGAPPVQMQPKLQPRSPRPHNASPQPGRNLQSLPFAPRGSPRGAFRGGPRGRGNLMVPSRGGFAPNVRMDNNFANGQIDPNSFVRPRGSGYTGRGGRKLWVPT
ncbi:hypothetical protein LTR37_004309 [Vermiconidia calcicola]|uniref:Uncharacterized protein n=1 Tax=Vermiconidia calcicola TaxID=1690605 RepID=A0ACC3NM10_9PEZI|nr:hypothetical protein LTR37_004309 [Vermiconidia calcicola]